MTMILLPRDNKRRQQRRRIRFGMLFIALAVVFSLNSLALSLFSSPVHAGGVPLLQSRNFLTDILGGFINVLSSKRALVKENLELRNKLAVQEVLQAEKRSLEEENKNLKALLGRGEPQREIVWARIVSKPGFSPYDTMILDVGSSEGVAVGDLIIVNQSAVVGEIAAVFPHSSNVILYSSPEQKVEVFIGEKALQTTALGKGGGNYEVRLPRNADIHEGDAVTMAKYPDKVFGAISAGSISESETDSYMKILFRSSADVTELRYVTVEKRPY